MTGAAVVLLPNAAIERPTTAAEVTAAWLLGYGNEGTRNGYRRDLEEWAGFAERIGVEPLAAHRAHIEAFARALEAAGRSRATIARKLAALSSFYTYAVDEGLVDRSPVRGRRPKVDADSQRLGLDRDELRALIAAGRKSGPRDAALVLLLTMNGLRVSEAVAATVDGLSSSRGHRTLTVVRKGEHRALVPLAPVVGEALDAMLEARPPIASDPAPLFATSSGRAMDRQAAGKVIRRLARQAHIDKPVSPHTLRHGFVTAALDAGAPLRDVQDAAGHADPRTTRRYDRGRHSLDRHVTYLVAGALAE
jgi:site-specific recombinase XerD